MLSVVFDKIIHHTLFNWRYLFGRVLIWPNDKSSVYAATRPRDIDKTVPKAAHVAKKKKKKEEKEEEEEEEEEEKVLAGIGA